MTVAISSGTGEGAAFLALPEPFGREAQSAGGFGDAIGMLLSFHNTLKDKGAKATFVQCVVGDNHALGLRLHEVYCPSVRGVSGWSGSSGSSHVS